MAGALEAAQEPGRSSIRAAGSSDASPIRIRSRSIETQRTLRVERRGGGIEVADGVTRVAFELAPAVTGAAEEGGGVSLALVPGAPLRAGQSDAVFAALELLFGTEPGVCAVALAGPNWSVILPEITAKGLAVPTGRGVSLSLASMVWQIRSGWMAGGDAPFPLAHLTDPSGRNPRRPPLAEGARYARFIPWLGGVLSFDTATLEDLAHLHRWMNDPRIDRFWREAGDLERHRAYINAQRSDPHTWPLIARFDGEAFGYFEIYWARESLIGPFYDAGDHDRGWHVLIGEEAFRGRRWVSAWLPSLMHMIFLDDQRTMRIVGEPAADHEAQLRNLSRSGFERIGTIDLPAKRAALVSLSRRRFFEDRLWHPAHDSGSFGV